jgi:hypothetical protein
VRPFPLGPLALALLLVAGCRFDFQLHPDAAPGVPDDVSPMTPDAALPLLSCGSPPQFAIENPIPVGAGSGSNAITLAGLTAVATDTHVYALAADSAGGVHGYSFEFDGANLVARTANAPVFTQATGSIAAVPAGDGVLALIVYGLPDPVGTALVPLDSNLAAAGPQQMYEHWYGGDRALALAPDGTTRTLLGFTSNGDEVDARLVAGNGTSLGTAHAVIGGSESASEPTITASDAGVLVTWSSRTASPDEVRATVFDKQLTHAMSPTPTTISPSSTVDELGPRVAYAPAQDRYLFVWWDKHAVDQVNFSLRDGQLNEIQPPIAPVKNAKFARVVAGKDDFLVAWQDISGNAPGLSAARIKFDGSFAPLPVLGHGNFALGWDLITRAGQPALVWFEDDPRINAWIDPLCN